MMCPRRLKGFSVFRSSCRYRVLLSIALAVSLCVMYTCNESLDQISRNFISLSAWKSHAVNKSFLMSIEDVSKLYVKSNGFLAATSTNPGKVVSHSTACVVDPAVTECSNIGFAAFLLITLDHIVLCRVLGSDQPVVFWRGCFSVCSRDRAVNSWNWYFEPVNPGLEVQVERVLCPLLSDINEDKAVPAELTQILNNSFKNRSNVEGFQKGHIITTEERMRTNKLIKQFVKPNSIIKQKVKTFYLRYLAGFTVLGVHVRGTDHWIETVEKRLPPLMDWVKSAQIILETLPRPRKIFIASDNEEIISSFLAFFGNETVVFTKAVRARRYHSKVAPHDFMFEYNPADPYERAVGTQVLMDILLLAKCDHFLHAESSVASLASYFNPHMKSYFMDKTFLREHEEVHERSKLQEIETVKQKEADGKDPDTDKSDEIIPSDILKCFLRNFATSTCPNAAKEIFVTLEGAIRFLKGQ